MSAVQSAGRYLGGRMYSEYPEKHDYRPNNVSERTIAGHAHDKLLSLERFRIACYIFRLRTTTPLTLPTYKGSTFHGGFGHSLAHVSTSFYNYFYNPQPPDHWRSSKQTPPNPFMLVPPLEETRHYRPGDCLELGLLLYGDAIQHFMIAFAALEHLGKAGLGAHRAHYEIDRVSVLTFEQPCTIYDDGHWFTQPGSLSAKLVFEHCATLSEYATLYLVTRLRLKHNNRLMRTSPSFALLLDRLLGRINSLASAWCGCPLLDRASKQKLTTAARLVRASHDNTRWSEWSRYSGSSGERMQFGGLLGEITYSGDLTPFLPWLALGEWTGVGGKTSFGLGLYQMHTEEYLWP